MRICRTRSAWRWSSCPRPSAASCSCPAAPVVERDFAWASCFRRLARDYERLPQVLAGLHVLAFACLMLRRLIPLLQVHNTL